MTNRHSAVLIGLGQIGMGYDLDLPSDQIYSHLRALQSHSQFRLISAVDPVESIRNEFEKRTGVKAVSTTKELTDEARGADLIVVAAPTSLHCALFEEVLQWNSRLILLEKPIAFTRSEGERMRAALAASSSACAVNYFRRFDPGMQALKKKIESGNFGEFRSGRGEYSKGLLNCGSHYVDLVSYLVGEPLSQKSLGKPRDWYMKPFDPDLDFSIGYPKGEINFSVSDWKTDEKGNVELEFSLAKVALTQFCNQIMVTDRKSGNVQSIPTDMRRYQWNVLDRLAAHLNEGLRLPSDFESAYTTFSICEKIIYQDSF